MKYIITKDLIKYTFKDNADYNQYDNIKNNILREADTIEELCDCFVTKGNKHIVWDKQHNKGIMFEQVKESYPNYHFEIYGAIWTDKGLIYVAKMNDKGELELIWKN